VSGIEDGEQMAIIPGGIDTRAVDDFEIAWPLL